MPISPTYVAAGYPLCKPFVRIRTAKFAIPVQCHRAIMEGRVRHLFSSLDAAICTLVWLRPRLRV